ncbi:tyrosine-protein phosphatase [Nocardioides sp. Kera G14]|uniref:tyrosine-protein phosphatase n=1 Tax=Nocardioides sp. Kera G14 TaxID=2884264 RepID=UPI001D0F7D87|nr:tyrosine-protein phosphatase [Nocardioides sp. Kera G14]UDY25183.1 tyrosine-protein phosphatase [Nocardioides sp. Kera G14]
MRLEVDGTYNFREVAPGVLVPGVLYRSDSLDRLGDAGRRMLAELGIGLVIDLRSDLDLHVSGPDLLDGTGIEYVRHQILSAGVNLDPANLDLRLIYREILQAHGPELALAIRAIADHHGAVLVHCTAGKDRTGLLVALILLALGVAYEAVVDDYVATTANLAGPWSDALFAKLAAYDVERTDTLVEVMAHAPEPVLKDVLDWVETEYGGVAAYLSSIGVDDAVLLRLRSRLLAEL